MKLSIQDWTTNIYQSNVIADQAETSYSDFCAAQAEVELRQFITQHMELLDQIKDVFQS